MGMIYRINHYNPVIMKKNIVFVLIFKNIT